MDTLRAYHELKFKVKFFIAKFEGYAVFVEVRKIDLINIILILFVILLGKLLIKDLQA